MALHRGDLWSMLSLSRRVSALFALALLTLSAPALSESSLRLSDAWVRALPPTQSSTAAYLTVSNTGTEVLVIEGASATLAGRAEIHTTREVDGLVRMERLPAVTIAPGESVDFAPGGTHIMLLDLERMPAAGEWVTLCLQPRSGAAACIEAPVSRGEVLGESEHQHHNHH
jgi:copper(I)-binding protein